MGGTRFSQVRFPPATQPRPHSAPLSVASLVLQSFFSPHLTKSRPFACACGDPAAGLMDNECLVELELQWNALGGSKSMSTCEAIAALLCSDKCKLEVLDVSCNRLGGVGKGGALGDMLAAGLVGSTRIRELRLDGNRMSTASTWSIASASSKLQGVRVSILGCVSEIVHPSQHNPNAPFGSYRLNLADTGARDLVRGVISLICRKKAIFEGDSVVHCPPGGGAEGDVEIRLPRTRYMQWEEWAVPFSGILTFKLLQPNGSLR